MLIKQYTRVRGIAAHAILHGIVPLEAGSREKVPMILSIAEDHLDAARLGLTK